MRRLLVGVMTAMFALGSSAAFAAQPTKTARGTVSAVGADSVTVKVDNKDVKFLVDSSTTVTARGGSTAERSAKAQGKSGPAITSVVKEGQTVEVRYHEPAMHAASITVLPAGAPSAKDSKESKAKDGAPAAKSSPSTTAGTVTAVSGSSLTLKTSAGDSTFTIDDKTHVVGSGL